MSLLQRIAETQGAKQDADIDTNAAMAVEATAPDAVEQDNNQRAAYANSLAAEPQVEMNEETPDAADQEEFTKAERAMAEIVFGPASNKVVTSIKNDRDPIMGIGTMAESVVTEITQQFPNLTEDATFALGESAVELIVELAEASITGLDVTPEQMSEALSIGIGQWADDNPDKMLDQDEYRQGGAPEQLEEEEAQQPQQAPVATPPIQNV